MYPVLKAYSLHLSHSYRVSTMSQMLGIQQQTGDRHSVPTCMQFTLWEEGNALTMRHTSN